MKGLLGLILSAAFFPAHAQSDYKLVNGKVYSVIDPNVWTVFYDHLKVIGYSQDGLICESYKTEVKDIGALQSGRVYSQYVPNRVSTIIPGQKLILKNYPRQPNILLEGDISPPIKAIRTGQSFINHRNHTWTTAPATTRNSSSVKSNSSRGEPVSIYDMGMDYFPPPRVLSPEEQRAAEKKRAEQEKKTVQWLFNQATNGSASAESSLGLRYLHGQGVPRDEASGLQWLQKAAAHGDAEARAKLEQLAAARTNSEASAISATKVEALPAKAQLE
jgi:hypothetical protein